MALNPLLVSAGKVVAKTAGKKLLSTVTDEVGTKPKAPGRLGSATAKTRHDRFGQQLLNKGIRPMTIDFGRLQNAGAHAQTLDFSKAQAVGTGERINFSKDNPGVTDIRVELYWESDHDGDASILLLDTNKQALKGSVAGSTDPNSTRGMVWYRNLSVPGVTHSGDVRTAGNDKSAPEETINVNLTQLDREANEVLVVASTFPEDDQGRGAPVPFGRLRNCKVMIINNTNNQVLYVYELDEDFSRYTSVELASFYQRNGEWRYTSMGEGVGQSAMALSDIASKYGLA